MSTDSRLVLHERTLINAGFFGQHTPLKLPSVNRRLSAPYSITNCLVVQELDSRLEEGTEYYSV